MELILIENVAKLGHAYDLVKVKSGYARNFLLPQKKAVPATSGMIAKAKKVQGERIKKLEELLGNAKALAEQLKEVTLKFTRKVRGEKLYGSIGAKDIVEALKESAKIELGKDTVKITNPIKTVGDHKVTLHLAEGVEVRLAVKVEAEA